MNKSYVLALDQGTTSSRAIVFGHDGSVRASAHREFAQLFPRTGWVEHDPQEIWASQIGVVAEALGRARIRPAEIAAVGITNQRETTIVWDRESGAPIANAIVWQDRRTAGDCQRLKAEGAEDMSRPRPAWSSTPTFPPRRSDGCLTTFPGRGPGRTRESWRSGPWTRGSSRN